MRDEVLGMIDNLFTKKIEKAGPVKGADYDCAFFVSPQATGPALFYYWGG